MFCGSTSIHLVLVTFHLFCLENSANSSIKDLYKGLSFNLSLSSITSQTLTAIDGILTITPLSLK